MQTVEDCERCEKKFRTLKNYKGSQQYVQRIRNRINQIEERKKRDKYNEYYKLMKSQSKYVTDIETALTYFESVPGYLDADHMAEMCRNQLITCGRLADPQKENAPLMQPCQNATEMRSIKFYALRLSIITWVVILVIGILLMLLRACS